MNPDHTSYAQWDAAYVLGALSPADRREFEEHLEGCPDCRRAVADLAPTVVLLSRLSPAEVEGVDEAPPFDRERSAAVLSRARDRARRRRRTRVLVLAAAAVLVIAAVAIPLNIVSTARPTESFALESLGTPLEADVQLTSVGWGTRIELDCRYPEAADPEDADRSWTYALAIVDADGTASTVSTWRSTPGSRARLSAGTALDVGDIRSIEIRTESGDVLMIHDLEE